MDRKIHAVHGVDDLLLEPRAQHVANARGHVERLLVLNSPVNPTGTAFDAATLGAICDAVVAENARRSPEEPPLYLLYD